MDTVGELRALGPHHPATPQTRHSLARWQGFAGDPDGAVAALTRLLRDRRRTLGLDHPDTLMTRHLRGFWRNEAGDLTGAITEYTALQRDQLRVLGPDHPDTLMTARNLAELHARNTDEDHPA